MKILNDIKSHLRQLAPHVRDRDTGTLLAAAHDEIVRLRNIATSAYDHVIHDEKNREKLLNILKSSWHHDKKEIAVDRNYVPGEKVFYPFSKKLVTVLAVYQKDGVAKLDWCGNTDFSEIEKYDPVKHAQYEHTFKEISQEWKMQYGIHEKTMQMLLVEIHDAFESRWITSGVADHVVELLLWDAERIIDGLDGQRPRIDVLSELTNAFNIWLDNTLLPVTNNELALIKNAKILIVLNMLAAETGETTDQLIAAGFDQLISFYIEKEKARTVEEITKDCISNNFKHDESGINPSI